MDLAATANIARATASIINAEGYAIVVARMLPSVETLIARRTIPQR